MANLSGRPRGESRLPAALAVLAAMLLYATLPERYTIGPSWLLPALEGALMVGLMLAAPRRRPHEAMAFRIITMGLTGLVTVANFVALGRLIDSLLHGTNAGGTQLIFASIQIWLTNVAVFALWFWELDRGGPGERHTPGRHPDFLFPQMATREVAPAGWLPHFVDYLYVSFTNAMAFSPTDTLPLTRWAKLLMLAQSMASLLTVALVAARAVNILT